MVNMSASNGNGNTEKPCTTFIVGEDSRPCCSVSHTSPQRIVESDSRETIKRSSPPHSDSNNHHTSTNGTSGTYENGESSGMQNCSTQFVCENNKQNETNSDTNNKEGLLRNTVENDHGNNSSSGVTPKVPNNLKSKVAHDYDRNSSSEDEECCIYTYKGDSNQMADLPSSFFRLDLVSSSRPNGNSGNSSPDMDYLEMDFDPGPSNDRYSSSCSECGEELFVTEEVPPLPEDRGELTVRDPEPTPPSPLSTPSPVRFEQACSSVVVAPTLRSPPPSPQQHARVPDIDSSSVQPSFCYCIANKLSPTSIDENFNEGGAGTMVWKEQEAKEKQVNQIATSACGATAVINVLLGLNVPFSVSSVKHHVATRLRNETAPVVEYLQSRCHAGATHVDMIRGLHNASNELVYARFFHMYPQRSISLTSWLSHWIRKGAVPIVTRNLQRGVRPGVEVPDVWHHQMVHGVSARGIHLTNPLEVQSEALLWPQLASPSLLKVRREDVLSRWTPDTPLHPLAHPSLPLWRKLNVLGQVVNVIRESNHCSQPSQHITIPASYCSGVTLAVLRNSPAYDELRFTPELPVDPFASS